MEANLIGLRIRELYELADETESGLDFGDLCADVLAPEGK